MDRIINPVIIGFEETSSNYWSVQFSLILLVTFWVVRTDQSDLITKSNQTVVLDQTVQAVHSCNSWFLSIFYICVRASFNTNNTIELQWLEH